MLSLLPQEAFKFVGDFVAGGEGAELVGQRHRIGRLLKLAQHRLVLGVPCDEFVEPLAGRRGLDGEFRRRKREAADPGEALDQCQRTGRVGHRTDVMRHLGPQRQGGNSGIVGVHLDGGLDACRNLDRSADETVVGLDDR